MLVLKLAVCCEISILIALDLSRNFHLYKHSKENRAVTQLLKPHIPQVQPRITQSMMHGS